MQPGLLHFMLVLFAEVSLMSLKDWQIVVTHFPPLPGAECGSVARSTHPFSWGTGQPRLRWGMDFWQPISKKYGDSLGQGFHHGISPETETPWWPCFGSLLLKDLTSPLGLVNNDMVHM